MTEKPKNITVRPTNILIVIAVMVIVVLIGGAILTKPAPIPDPVPIAPPTKSPVMRVVVSRICDFITIQGRTTALCTDNTEWNVNESTPAEPQSKSLLEEVLGTEQVLAAGEEPGRDTTTVTESAVVVAAVPPATTEMIKIRYSYYWPPLGGPNCSNFVGGKCISRMASGEKWEDYVGSAIACPAEIPFGTQIVFDGIVWTCRDRGGKIKYVNGIPWIDFLSPTAARTYGEVVTAQLVK